jgi:hypothetical protein
MPIVMITKEPYQSHWGEFDGVYAVSGYSIASEDIITINTTDYLVIQNAFRTESDNYVAIKLD